MRAFALLVAALALTAAACNSGSDQAGQEPIPPRPAATQQQPATQPSAPASSAHFTKRQLGRAALQPADAPNGMRYTRVDSGRKSLAQIGYIVDRQISQVRDLGFQAVYDATFDSTTTDVRLASRLWLFAKPEGAQKWLEKTAQDSQTYGFEPISAPPLGDDAWAGKGNVGADVITYAFRTGNLVVVTSYETQSEQLSQSAKLAAAEKAAERAASAAA